MRPARSSRRDDGGAARARCRWRNFAGGAANRAENARVNDVPLGYPASTPIALTVRSVVEEFVRGPLEAQAPGVSSRVLADDGPEDAMKVERRQAGVPSQRVE